MKSIGVLALQGAVSEHMHAVERVGAKALEIKTAAQLNDVDGLIIPGGESTAIRRLMKRYDFIEPLKDFARTGKGIIGTCAGLVLLADEIEGGEEGLGLINCKVRRNGFGRQKESFETELDIPALGGTKFSAIFIRAPWIVEAGKGVEVLACYNEKIVAAKNEHVLVTAFHPELSEDDRLIDYFIKSCVD